MIIFTRGELERAVELSDTASRRRLNATDAVVLARMPRVRLLCRSAVGEQHLTAGASATRSLYRRPSSVVPGHDPPPPHPFTAPAPGFGYPVIIRRRRRCTLFGSPSERFSPRSAAAARTGRLLLPFYAFFRLGSQQTNCRRRLNFCTDFSRRSGS